MCGRFTKRYTWSEVHSFLRLELLRGEVADALFAPRFNVAPTQEVGVARAADEHAAEFVSMRWGLIPSWSKDPKRPAINARAETVASNAMFRTAFRRRRCLIPVSGFYEWQARAGELRKQPWYFFPANAPLFAFGGLWERWTDGAITHDTFAIVTTLANEFVQPVHDRMPLIVAPEHHQLWLFGSPDEVSSLLVPAPGTALAAHRVSERVNSPRLDDESLVAIAE